jgi:nicotianamine synthase
VKGSQENLRKFAFIGSGPLPLTSLCLVSSIYSNLAEISVLNIDSSAHAISLSKTLCSQLGEYARGMSFLCSDASAPSLDLSGFDVVYLAALVGTTQAQKEKVLQNVVRKMRPGALLVVRSADRLRGLMYPVCYSVFPRPTGKLMQAGIRCHICSCAEMS